MPNDYRMTFEQFSRSGDSSHAQAQANVEQLSTMLEVDESTDTCTEETGECSDKLKAAGVKGLIAVTAAASVMGITSMMHPEKAREVTPPIEPAPIEEIVDAVKPAFNLEDDAPAEPRQMPVIEERVETKAFTWWHDVPPVSQQDLTYRGRETDYGCAPTAVSMVTEYWHQQDPRNETRSAQTLLDANVEQGVFKGGGMSITDLHDELSALGYEAQNYADADLETLKREVANGPVIAAVKLGMRTDGTPHSVVVTGISENNEVRVNDPWTGEVRTYSWKVFSRSWGSAFQDVSSHNHFTTVRPA